MRPEVADPITKDLNIKEMHSDMQLRLGIGLYVKRILKLSNNQTRNRLIVAFFRARQDYCVSPGEGESKFVPRVKTRKKQPAARPSKAHIFVQEIRRRIHLRRNAVRR